MYYSEFQGKIPVYDYYPDDEGNIIKLETGNYKSGYAKPREMYGNIAFNSGEVEPTEYGLSVSDYDCSLITTKEAYPITETSLIWLENEPKYKDDTNGTVDEKSADFKVVAVKPSTFISKYLLKRITK